MLFLLLQIGKDRYGLDAGRIVEVLPAIHLKKLPQAPRGVAGVFNYHGELVPVVDLSEFALGQPTPASLSTRVILVRYPLDAGETHLLGLRAEKATETLRIDTETFHDCGVELAATPYLGPIAQQAGGLVQRIDIEKLLSQELRDRLFQPTKIEA